MTKEHEPKKREELPALALLWGTKNGSIPIAAPEQFGGQRWQEQLDSVTERTKQEGVTLTTEGDVFMAHVSGDGSAGERLDTLIDFLNQHPTPRLFVPGSVFADLSDPDRSTYSKVLLMFDTELIFCD